MIITPNRSGLPRCPFDIREQVELYARESGRSATVHFVPNCGWMARFSLKPNDKRMKAYQEGRAPKPPTEDVWFRVPKDGRPQEYEYLDILQMGPSGVKEFLERGNTWSGRGEHRSHIEAHQKALDAQSSSKGKAKKEAKEHSRDRRKDTRRQRLKIPFHRVGIDLKSEDGAD